MNSCLVKNPNDRIQQLLVLQNTRNDIESLTSVLFCYKEQAIFPELKEYFSGLLCG